MKRVMERLLIPVMCLTVLVVLSGCSVSDRALNNAQKRIDALRAKGVPDSSLSSAEVYLYQARDSKQRGNRGLARMSADSLSVLLAQGEADYNQNMERIKPALDSMRRVIDNAARSLTGLQKKRLDRALVSIDSLISMNWLIPAEAKSRELVAALPGFASDEARAQELKPRVPGAWVCTNVSKSTTDPTVNAVEKKVFTFGADGSAKLDESKKGKSTPTLIEDWQFLSYGTYDIGGDTVFMYVKRFQAIRQNFQEMLIKPDGKKEWKKSSHPTYDSTITDGSQDRFITFSDLTEDFKK